MMSTTRYTTLLVVFGMLFVSSLGFGQAITDYVFTTGTGTRNDMSTGTTTIIANAVDDGSSGIQNIGFNFVFAGTTYTQYSVSSNGAMRLGSTVVSTTFTNNLTVTLPMIASFFEDMHTGVYDANGYVKYRLTGSAPNRVMTVEWRARAYSSNLGTEAEIFNWQVRLYETSNKIEFLYIKMRSDLSTTATIGIANSTTANNYISITPGSPVTSSRTAINNSANIGTATNAIAANTLFTFNPCQPTILISGNPALGGTSNMANGDTLLASRQVMRGSKGTYTPFTISQSATACANRVYTYSISGANAGDYAISPTTGPLSANQSATPTITFTPQGTGIRTATLTVRDDNGFNRSYTLLAQGLSRINWVGNVAQGGTASLLSGDTILNFRKVPFQTSETFTPITIQNINTDPLATPAAPVSYTLIDPTGTYSITPSNAALNSGQNSMPQITFNAIGAPGLKVATLIVTAEGETRTFTLNAFNAAPAGVLLIDGKELTEGVSAMRSMYACVGSDVKSVEVVARNTGDGPFIVTGAAIFGADTTIGQGAQLALLKDQFGQPIPSVDYFLTNAPGTAPRTANPQFTPLVVPEGQSRTFYLNIIPIRPGKRNARIYFTTNGLNSHDEDVNGTPVDGLIQAGLYAGGLGSSVVGNANGTPLKGVEFKPTDVRKSVQGTGFVYNNGSCDLFISRTALSIVSGDVSEFAIISTFPNSTVAGDYYVIPPGRGDSVVFSFTPQSFGSRRATVRLVTNDSTLFLPGISERGVYNMDLYGVGRVGLETRDLTLNPAVIGSESSAGKLLVENTSGGNVQITGIQIVGGNGDIKEDAANRWPTLPRILPPGQQLQLGIILDPDPNGVPGTREATVRIAIQGGDTVVAVVRGYAGSRVLNVTPPTLFANTKVSLGGIARSYVALTNTGSLPIRLETPTVTGANPTNYRVSPLQRRVVEPGQTEILEVTFIPLGSGPSSAQLEIRSNATNGLQVVTLGGESSSTVKGGIDPSEASQTEPVPGIGIGRSATTDQGNELLLFQQVVPNPATESVSLSFNLPNEGEVYLALYDEAGRLVRNIEQRWRGKGEHLLDVNVSDLPTGTYLCCLRFNDRLVTRTLQVGH